MTDARSSNSCGVRIADHTGFHWYPCGRKAKEEVTDGHAIMEVCGIHKRVWERRKEILGDRARFPHSFYADGVPW